MKFLIFRRVAAMVSIPALVLAAAACRKPASRSTVEVTVPVELKSNGLSALPGAVYRSQAGSPIHWQPWTRETFDRAKAANRMIIAVIAMPQQPGFQEVLESLAADAERIRTLNEDYVPVLVDGDAAREMGLLTADLCAEIQRGLQLPLFLWITPQGNPVAWIPVPGGKPGSVAELFNQSHSMVSRMWKDDNSYVVNNSELDNKNRRDRISKRKTINAISEQPAEDVVRALRQLSSLYDPLSRNFDQTGGLFPSGAIDLLASGIIHPGVPRDVRAKCRATTRDLMTDLLRSAMFDPLDGGVFSAKRGSSWALPVFTRDCPGQARAAVALLRVYLATGDPLALERGLGVIAFSERAFSTTDGLFSVGMSKVTPPAAWLWSVEDVEKALSPGDAEWWIKATGMAGLGNLPLESDPLKEYFRSNSLAMEKSVAELAAQNAQPLATFMPRFEAARKRLLKIREERLGDIPRDDTAHATATFRMVSAYAAAFCATGDPKFREKAVALLGKARTAFSDGPKLRVFSKPTPPSIGAGRGFVYGLALQSVIDVADISSDEVWMGWAEDLATTSAELFTGADFLKECPDDAKIIDLPITDLVMVFDDSTAGLISSAGCRLASRGRPLVKTFSDLASPLPGYAVDRPVLHTDLLQATLARLYPVDVVVGTDLSPELKLAIERMPVRTIQRRPAVAADAVPPGSVKVTIGGEAARVISTAAALREAVLPSL